MSIKNLTLKTSLHTLSTLTVGDASAEELEHSLSKKRAAAPGLFSHFPCILSLPERHSSQLSLSEIRLICENNGIFVVGVSGSMTGWEEELEQQPLAEFFDAMSKNQIEEDEPAPIDRQLKIHEGNVRSGQQLYSKGDLIVLGNVSPGSDVAAEGDIHIYGHLRGRALAGIPENESAVISCQHFDAELVSIGGAYQHFSDPDRQAEAGHTIVQLQENRLTYIRHK